jgi:arabinose-5-phosphate isomerase
VTAEATSTLGKAADVVLLLPQAREACPHNLAPTTSSLMQQALGDALAVALLGKPRLHGARFPRPASGRPASAQAEVHTATSCTPAPAVPLAPLGPRWRTRSLR